MGAAKRSCSTSNLGELKVLYNELTESHTSIEPEDEACATDLINKLDQLKKDLKSPVQKLA